MSPEPVTFVTIVYRAEDSLLRLQAHSVARFVAPGALAEIIVVDNGRPALSPRRRAELVRAYGPHGDRVRFVHADDLAGTEGMSGWIGQQVLKLAVARLVHTPWYVLLDAKNHLVRPLRPGDLLTDDGRARGGFHSYESHPLRERLLTTLDYLGIDQAAAQWYPPTSTPFIMQTMTVDEILTALGDDFATAFARGGLSEFFLYSGWILRRDGDWSAVYDGTALQCPTIWGGGATPERVAAVLAEVEALDAPFLGVHRRALRRIGGEAFGLLARFWVSEGLFPNPRAAGRFRVRFLREHAVAALRARLVRARE